MLKGNHDYWWGTLTSMRKYINSIGFTDIDFIYNNSYEFEDKIICGTRGWNFSGIQEEDEKIYNREKQRLKLSLEDGVNRFGKDKDIIACLHYPPLKIDEISDFVRIMEDYNVKKCIYGHLHGPAVSTFYYWVKQLRKEAAQIPAPAYGHSENPRPKQDVVPIDIVPERFPVQHTPYLDNPHTLEIILGSATIRVTNETDPQLLSRTLQILKGSLC